MKSSPTVNKAANGIKQLQELCSRGGFNSVSNLPQQSANAEAFIMAYLHCLVPASAKKMPRQLSNDDEDGDDDVFHTNCKLDFMMQIIYYTFICICVLFTYFCNLFSYFCCSLISVSKKWDIERILTQGIVYRNTWLGNTIIIFII